MKAADKLDLPSESKIQQTEVSMFFLLLFY